MYDVFAIGNALVDHEYLLSDEALSKTELTKSNMTLASFEEQQALLQSLKDIDLTPAKKTGGGSAANSMYAFSCLGGKAFYNCRVGDDKQGQFYLQDLNDAGVTTSAKAIQENEVTGTCLVAVTPDAERTMQTYLGTSAQISDENIDYNALIESQWLYIEGYLAMSETLLPAMTKIRQQAGINNVNIAVSFADPSVVKFAKEGLLQILGNGVDLITCNLEEAQLFTGKKHHKASARALTEYCRIAVVTNGAHGAIICRVSDKDNNSDSDSDNAEGNDEVEIIEVPTPSVTDVIDTNGAGDNYAGAFLYALTQQYTLAECGELASAVASQVIQQVGPRLDVIRYQDIARRVLDV